MMNRSETLEGNRKGHDKQQLLVSPELSMLNNSLQVCQVMSGALQCYGNYCLLVIMTTIISTSQKPISITITVTVASTPLQFQLFFT